MPLDNDLLNIVIRKLIVINIAFHSNFHKMDVVHTTESDDITYIILEVWEFVAL